MLSRKIFAVGFLALPLLIMSARAADYYQPMRLVPNTYRFSGGGGDIRIAAYCGDVYGATPLSTTRFTDFSSGVVIARSSRGSFFGKPIPLTSAVGKPGWINVTGSGTPSGLIVTPYQASSASQFRLTVPASNTTFATSAYAPRAKFPTSGKGRSLLSEAEFLYKSIPNLDEIQRIYDGKQNVLTLLRSEVARVANGQSLNWYLRGQLRLPKPSGSAREIVEGFYVYSTQKYLAHLFTVDRGSQNLRLAAQAIENIRSISIPESKILTARFRRYKAFSRPDTLSPLRHTSADPEKPTSITVTQLNGSGFLGLGDGDSIVVKQANDHVVVIDTGRQRSAPNLQAVLERYRKPGTTLKVDLILTHEDADHIGGVGSLAELPWLSINEICLSRYSKGFSQTVEETIGKRFPLKMDVGSNRLISYRPGYSSSGLTPTFSTDLFNVFSFGQDPCKLTVIQYRFPENPNQASLVIKVENQGRSYLLTADIDTVVMRHLTADPQIAPLLRADGMKFPHHVSYSKASSFTSTLGKFLRAVDPVIIDFSNRGARQTVTMLEQAAAFCQQVLGPYLWIRSTITGNAVTDILLTELHRLQRLPVFQEPPVSALNSFFQTDLGPPPHPKQP